MQPPRACWMPARRTTDPGMGAAMIPEEKKKANLRLALVLASIALAFFLGLVAKLVFFGR